MSCWFPCTKVPCMEPHGNWDPVRVLHCFRGYGFFSMSPLFFEPGAEFWSHKPSRGLILKPPCTGFQCMFHCSIKIARSCAQVTHLTFHFLLSMTNHNVLPNSSCFYLFSVESADGLQCLNRIIKTNDFTVMAGIPWGHLTISLGPALLSVTARTSSALARLEVPQKEETF